MAKKSKQQVVKQNIEIKQEDSTTQKISSFLSKIFCGQDGIQKQINQSIVSNTYYQILEVIHTVLLFSIFNETNNQIYSIIQSSIGGYFFLVCMIPRISKKNLIFQINFILYLLGTIGSGLAMILLFKNFSTFEFYCTQIRTYYQKKSTFIYPSKSLCQKIYQMYMIQVICEIIILFLRLFYLVMCFRAYMIAQEKHDEEEKKKRRRDRYNQLLMKRTTYNEKRKV